MNHLLKAWALEDLPIVVCFLLLGIPVTALDEESRPSILNLRVDSLKVAGADMEEALRLLRQIEPSKILIGFERLPHPEEEKETNISFELNQTTRETLGHGNSTETLVKLWGRNSGETLGGNSGKLWGRKLWGRNSGVTKLWETLGSDLCILQFTFRAFHYQSG